MSGQIHEKDIGTRPVALSYRPQLQQSVLKRQDMFFSPTII